MEEMFLITYNIEHIVASNIQDHGSRELDPQEQLLDADRFDYALRCAGIKMISQKWKDCTDLEISLPIINAGSEELLAAILHSSQQPSQLRYLHLCTNKHAGDGVLTPSQRDLHVLLVSWMLCQTASLEILTIQAFVLPALPALPKLRELLVDLSADNMCSLARCLPHLRTLTSISLRVEPFWEEEAAPELPLANLLHLQMLKLHDVLPTRLTLREGFRGLHIAVSTIYGVTIPVWEEFAAAIVSFEWESADESDLPDTDSLPAILQGPHSFDCLTFHVASIGKSGEPMLLQGAIVQAEHISIWAQSDIYVVIPSSEVAWKRVHFYTNEILSLTFTDLPRFVGKPAMFCFQYNCLLGPDVPALAFECGKRGIPWYNYKVPENGCAITNFKRPCEGRAEVSQYGYPGRVLYGCSCSACDSIAQGLDDDT